MLKMLLSKLLWGIAFISMFIVPVLLCLGPHYFHYRHDRRAIEKRYVDFYQSFDNEDYETAFSYMSPQYQQTVTIEEFKKDFYFLCETFCWTLHPTRYLNISGDKAYLFPDRFSLLEASGPEFELVKISDEWYFTGNYEYYIDGATSRGMHWR